MICLKGNHYKYSSSITSGYLSKYRVPEERERLCNLMVRQVIRTRYFQLKPYKLLLRKFMNTVTNFAAEVANIQHCGASSTKLSNLTV